MTFNWSPVGQLPVDPAYTRFLEGLKRLSIDDHGVRWNAKEQKWYTYAQAKWIMEDLGLSDTPAGRAIESKMGNNLKLYWEVRESFVPDLFKNLQKAAAAHMQRYPKADLVWGPYGGGNWRNAIRRPAPAEGYPTVPPGGQTAPGDFPDYPDGGTSIGDDDYPQV